jgi:hypothetical protein
MVNLKGFGRKLSYLIQVLGDILPGMTEEKHEKVITDRLVPIEIRTEYPANTSPLRYLYTKAVLWLRRLALVCFTQSIERKRSWLIFKRQENRLRRKLTQRVRVCVRVCVYPILNLEANIRFS